MILTVEQGMQRFEELLREPFNEMGFTVNDGYVTRKKQFGKEDLYYEKLDIYQGDRFYMSNSARKYIDPIEDLWIEFIAEMQLVRGITMPTGRKFPTLIFNATLIRDYTYDPANVRKWIRVNEAYDCPATEEGLRQMANAFLYDARSFVIPLFDVYNDIELLDACINESPDHFFEIIHMFSGVSLFYKKIVIAKLAGNKDYELVCEACRKRLLASTDTPDEVRDIEYSIFERIYQKLKDISPLKDTVIN